MSQQTKTPTLRHSTFDKLEVGADSTPTRRAPLHQPGGLNDMCAPREFSDPSVLLEWSRWSLIVVLFYGSSKLIRPYLLGFLPAAARSTIDAVDDHVPF